MAVIKVLVVEDDGIIGMSIEKMLSEKGYDCKLVASGEAAIAMLPEYGPDIVLMDIGLGPAMDGITAMRIIRKNHKNLPAIFITQQNDDCFFEQAKETFPNHYLTKPFTETALHRAILLALQGTGTAEAASMPPGALESVVSDGIFVRTVQNVYKKLLFENILYLVAKGAYTDIYFRSSQDKEPSFYTVSLSSNNVAKQLDRPWIVKVHKSYYVNLRQIDSLLPDEVSIAGHTVPVSRDYKPALLDRLQRLSKR